MASIDMDFCGQGITGEVEGSRRSDSDLKDLACCGFDVTSDCTLLLLRVVLLILSEIYAVGRDANLHSVKCIDDRHHEICSAGAVWRLNH